VFFTFTRPRENACLARPARPLFLFLCAGGVSGVVGGEGWGGGRGGGGARDGVCAHLRGIIVFIFGPVPKVFGRRSLLSRGTGFVLPAWSAKLGREKGVAGGVYPIFSPSSFPIPFLSHPVPILLSIPPPPTFLSLPSQRLGSSLRSLALGPSSDLCGLFPSLP